MHPRPILALTAALLSLFAGACGGGGGGGAGGGGDLAGYSSETTIAPAAYEPSGTVYYVSPEGSDGNDGRSPSAPWHTLRHAASALRAGDRLVLRGGRYVDDYFRPTASGTREKPIVVTAHPNEVPVITGRPTYDVFFHLLGVKWIVIDGLHFADTSRGTQVAIDDASYVIVRNSTFSGHRGGTMINAGRSDHLLIELNSFDTTGNRAAPGSGDNIYLRGTTHSVVQHNYFTRAGHYALSLINYGPAGDQRYSKYNVVRHNTIEQRWGGGIGIIRGSHDNVVEQNRILHIGEGVDYPKSGMQIAAEKNIVRRNVIGWASTAPYSNSGLAVNAYSFAGVVQHARHNRIYNNLVYKSGRSAVTFAQKDTSINSHNKLVNNIFYYNRLAGPHEPYWPAGNYYLTVETYHAAAGNKWKAFPNNNLFLRNVMLHADSGGDRPDEDPFVFYDQDNWGHSLAWVQSSFPAAFQGNLAVNPRLRDPERRDFALAPGSPARDAGAALARTRAAGSAVRTVPVDDSRFFADGFGVVRGDTVRIGANPPVEVTEVDHGAGTLGVSAPVSFAAGDPVDLDYGGAGPDIGPVEG